MELGWLIILLLLFGSLLILMMSGLHVAIAFMLLNIAGVFFLWGGEGGLKQFIFSLMASVSIFSFVAVPMFVLMGEVMFHAGIAPNLMDALDKWIGRLPGRLALLAVGAGVLFGTLTGASMASVAMLGSVLVPEMEKRGYKKQMSLGPILGSGGLAMLIPPSSLAVLLGALGEISIGRILIAIIIPGLLLAALYATYIITRCTLQPHLAPSYVVTRTLWSEKLLITARYVMPAGIVVFLVIGVMLLGVATPSEAASTGALGMFLLAAIYRRLSWEVLRKSVMGTVRITVMLYVILAGAQAFGQILAYTGTTKGLADFAMNLPVPRIFVIFAMQVILLILGCFMEPASIMMVTLPLFVPIVAALGFDTVWFAALYMLNMEMAVITPPFGLNLYVMKSVAPKGTTIADCVNSAVPFMICGLIALGLVMLFPALAQWLPSKMR